MIPLRKPPRYDDLRAAPELAALAVLDMALDVARAALFAENPEIENVGDAFQGRAPPLYLALTSLIVARADDLSDLLAWYRLALDDLRRRRDRDDMPF